MKSWLTKLISVLVYSGIITSCYYDKESILYPSTQACNTPATVSYAQHIVPILQLYCYGCHSGVAPGGNIAMGTYSADNAIATNGKLYGSVSWSAGYQAMPLGAGKLGRCNIELIKKWVESGAPNN